MKITAVRATWLSACIPPERAHVSDFDRNDTFNTCLVEIDTDAGLTGLGEAKVGVGAAGAVDILQPDLAIAGGLTECQRICALAAAHELTVAPHLWGGAILFASGLHLCVATPCATTVEFSRGENPLLHELVEEPFALQDGYVLAPERPGLGLTLRRDFVRTIAVD